MTLLLAVLGVAGLAAGADDAALTVIVEATLVDGGGRAIATEAAR